ncbi:hypothetical protein O0235_11435 [Tepidiforma flava]|uniref:Uncharacterized protein n=1 Tax=Tepidiforma flava TaxID=3004094 RepID=A0ABY7M4D2_9CHLR|nr:hypothetical protein [Tepidiforma flava]WBL35386.1 hypothetical protein O0235_11435 [Tepidiforma flava]
MARNKLHAQVRVLEAIGSPAAGRLDALRRRILEAASLDEVRGLEGWVSPALLRGLEGCARGFPPGSAEDALHRTRA